MIVVKNLTKSFDDQPVLRGVNLQIDEGKVTAIIGGSGCGKSVLLKHMIGLIKPDEGEVLIRGKNIARLSKAELNEIRKKMGMVFQGSAMFDSMTIGENVSMALRRFSNFSDAEIQKRIQKALALVQLNETENRFPSELSGGMKKRAAIARALVTEPEVLFYDEPTTGLDPPRADSINQLIIDLNQQLGITSIVVTHDMHSVFRIAHKVAMLDGVIRFYGTPVELLNCTEPTVKAFLDSARGHELLAEQTPVGEYSHHEAVQI